MRDFWY